MQATAVTSPAKPSEPCSTTAATEFSVSSFVKGDLEARPSPAGTSFYRPRMCLNGEEGRSKVEVVVAQCFRPLPKDDSPATYLTGMRVTHLGEEPQVGPWTAEGHLIDKAGCVAYLRDNADALMQGRITEKKGITAHKLLLERGNHHEALRTYFTLVVEETLGPLVEKKKGSLLPVVGRERSPMVGLSKILILTRMLFAFRS
ncbi:hypothetical protein WJX84_004199 [Apatococcus fuscideae]|uniref:Uncharacterized protein n=1 Tax=Apatococcus fuscideae TaxID=2026836 RepID=A0AAW1SZ89_9CHLO